MAQDRHESEQVWPPPPWREAPRADAPERYGPLWVIAEALGVILVGVLTLVMFFYPAVPILLVAVPGALWAESRRVRRAAVSALLGVAAAAVVWVLFMILFLVTRGGGS